MMADSLIPAWEDMQKCVRIIMNDNTAEKLMQTVNLLVKELEEREAVAKECERLKKELDVSNANVVCINNKLTSARQMFDNEMQVRKKLEMERNAILSKLEEARRLLFYDNTSEISKETKDRFSFLNAPTDRYGPANARLNTIAELDTTSSNMSECSFSRSEDDLEASYPVYGRRKNRPSFPAEEMTPKRKKSTFKSPTRAYQEIVTSTGRSLHSSTTVTLKPGGLTTAKSILETGSSPEEGVEASLLDAKATPQCSQATTPQRSQATTPQRSRTFFVTPKKGGCERRNNEKTSSSYTPSAPPPQPESGCEEDDFAHTPGMAALNSRQHAFVEKKIVFPELCTQCGKKIKFSRIAARCVECNALCHPECSAAVPLPCVRMGTPNKAGVVGPLSDYTPVIPPMVPAIVIHCVNEVQQRGLKEVGIYRVPGTETSVKALKEKFLRCKGVPNLSDLDIHSVCACLKDFLRSLPDSIIPRDSWDSFSRAVQNEERKKETMMRAISDLPQANRDTLAFLMLHLQSVAASPHCKMPYKNLATVFGPTLVAYPENIENPGCMYGDNRLACDIVEELLELPSSYWSRFINVSDAPGLDDIPPSLRTAASTDSVLRNASKRMRTPSVTPVSKRKFFETPTSLRKRERWN